MNKTLEQEQSEPHPLAGSNEATGKCELCGADASWSMHYLGNDKQKDHISVCEKTKCFDEATARQYHGCGCGG